MTGPADPVLERRQRLARLARTGRRLGYSLYGVSLAAFVAGFLIGFTAGPATVAAITLIVGSVLLAAVDNHRLRREARPTGPTSRTTGSRRHGPPLGRRQVG